MLLLVLEIENKNTIHWIHQFVVRLNNIQQLLGKKQDTQVYLHWFQSTEIKK